MDTVLFISLLFATATFFTTARTQAMSGAYGGPSGSWNDQNSQSGAWGDQNNQNDGWSRQNNQNGGWPGQNNQNGGWAGQNNGGWAGQNNGGWASQNGAWAGQSGAWAGQNGGLSGRNKQEGSQNGGWWPFGNFPFGGSFPKIVIPTPWYEGPNVCKEEKEEPVSADDPFEGMGGNSRDSSTTCKGDMYKYVCVTRSRYNGEMKQMVKSFQCCPGFIRTSDGSPGCVAGTP